MMQLDVRIFARTKVNSPSGFEYIYRSMHLHSSFEIVIELNTSLTDFFNEISSKH